MFAPDAPCRHALRDPGARRARRAHDLQPARPADEPGRAHAPAHGRRRPRATSSAIAGAFARLGADRVLVVSSEDGLDEMSTSGADPRGGGARRQRSAASASRPRTSASTRRARGPDGGTPEVNAAIGAADPRRRARRAARRRRAERRRRDLRGRSRRHARAPACAPPRRRSTPVRRGRAGALRRVHPEPRAGHRRMNTLERIVDSTRREVERRAATRPARDARAASWPRAARTARSPRRCVHPGISVIAEHKRRSPSAGAIREGATVDGDRLRLRARRRGRAVDPHRGPALRRLARRPARGARGDAPADPAQGLRRRPLPAVRVGRRRRRRDPADRRRARAARAGAPAPRGARARPRRARRGPRRARAGGRAGARRRRDRHQQPRPDRLHGRPRAHVRAAGRRPGRQDRRLGVGHRDARPARRARARRRRRGARGRGADARRRRRSAPAARSPGRATTRFSSR